MNELRDRIVNNELSRSTSPDGDNVAVDTTAGDRWQDLFCCNGERTGIG